MKKIAILIIVGTTLVLGAAFLYINKDLFVNRDREAADNVSSVNNKNTTLPPGKQDAGVTGTASGDETTLDAVFGGEELVDNFDDIVQ